MGLDMYLHAKTYVTKVDWSTMDEYDNVSTRPEFDNVIKAAGLSDVAVDVMGAEVSVTCAYWRKANAIHAWFVENVQGGEDNCREYYVKKDELVTLKDLCTKALISRDASLLPPQEGFFFGSYEIDEWYWQGLADTIKQLDKVLSLPNLDDLTLYYQSSW
jgi:hypothetical protein